MWCHEWAWNENFQKNFHNWSFIVDAKVIIAGLRTRVKGRATAKKVIQELAEQCGMRIDGSNPWDPQVKDERFYNRVFAHGSIGLGESYMEGWWDCERLDEFFYKVTLLHVRNLLDNPFRYLATWLEALFLNRQSRNRSKKVIDVHYNLSNAMYRAMLGESMAYTCGYWKNAKTLDEAQYAKYDLICQKLRLKPGERVLELGCGWGGFAQYASEKYGVHLVSVNISEEQIKFARETFKGAAEFHLCDYRDRQAYNPTGEKFDKAVSIGMCEHVGVKNYRSWLQLVAYQLKDHGMFLLHSIGSHQYDVEVDPWMNKYIFPNSTLPSPRSLGSAIDNVLNIEDWHDFGVDYHTTLMEWFKNFDADWQAHRQVPNRMKLTGMNQETFYRMWKYYLMSVAGGFRSRYISLWQLVLSKKGILGGYPSIR